MLYILSLCTILPEPLRSTAPHQLCHVRHVRFGLLMTSLMLPHCLLIPRACCDPIAMCCAACDAAAADALPCDAQMRCELRIQLRTCGTLCANCASTPLHSSHFPYALPQHHLPLQDPSLDPMRVLQRRPDTYPGCTRVQWTSCFRKCHSQLSSALDLSYLHQLGIVD